MLNRVLVGIDRLYDCQDVAEEVENNLQVKSALVCMSGNEILERAFREEHDKISDALLPSMIIFVQQ